MIFPPLFHKMTAEQYQLLFELQHADYWRVEPMTSVYAYRGETLVGLEFEWLHGLGDGKDVVLQGVSQPRWFARRVRKILAKQGIGRNIWQ